MSDAKEEEVVTDLRNADVVTKYRLAGDIATAALKIVTELCKAGVKIVDVCTAGDVYINEATGKIYNKVKGIEKGIAFPVSVSINNIVGHFSPVSGDETEIKEGDICKIDLGVHVDGYIAVVADTICVGGPATGKAGDLLAACHYATEAAIRMLKAGQKNNAITEMITKVAEDFKCNAVHGVLSHNMHQFVIDGTKTIINKSDVEEKVDEIEFETNEVYAVDIVLSTGDGKPREVDGGSATIYKKSEETYQLKMQASRAVFSDIKKRFPVFPFTLRSMTEKTARFGIKECVTHKLVNPYPVLQEKDGDLVAHVKFTALLMPNGTLKIAGPQLSPEMFATELKVTDEELLKLLATSAGAKKKKKKNNKKKKAGAAEAE